jgi:membrane protein DedA with SNARE-associated domain
LVPDFVIEALTSYPTLFILCVFVGFPVPFPEDILVMTAGTLVAEGKLEFWKAALTCGAGMFIRDLNSFLVARRFSSWLIKKPRVRRFVGERNIERWSHLFETRGGLGIFLVRFAVGTRVKLFFVAAAFGVRTRTFIIADLLGMCIVSPLLLWLGYKFGQPIVDGLTRALAFSGPIVSLVLIAAFVLLMLRWRRKSIDPDPLPDP